MTNLPIHITTHHLSLSDSLRDIVRKKIATVTRFANDAIAAEIGLRRHGGAQTRFSASARLSLPGRDVRGHAVDPDLYAAIRKLVAKLGRLLRKRKTRLAKAFKHPGRRENTQWEAAPPFQEDRSDLPKVSRSSRVRDGGQEMRVFGFRRRPRFVSAPDHQPKGFAVRKSTWRSAMIVGLCCSALISFSSCSRPAEVPAKTIEITANDKMKYNIEAFDVKPGQKVVVTLKNIGTQAKASMGHDFVVLKQNVNAPKFVETNSSYAARGDIAPETVKDIVAHTKLLGPGESDTVTFTAPYITGPYEFVCSFPGHYGAGMKGVMNVQ